MSSHVVNSIIASLGDEPEAWTISQESVMTGYRACNQPTENAQLRECEDRQRDTTEWNKKRQMYVPMRWEEPQYRVKLTLAHCSSEVSISDADASDCRGWEVERPEHLRIGIWASWRLSRAALRWREWNTKRALIASFDKAKEEELSVIDSLILFRENKGSM